VKFQSCFAHANSALKLIKCILVLLISSFRRVLYVVCFLLGNYPASGVYFGTSFFYCVIRIVCNNQPIDILDV